MKSEDEIEISFGVPENQRGNAAAVYFEAFQQKFKPILAPRTKGLAILEAGMNYELAVVAVHGDKLIGVAGLQYDGHCFVEFSVSTFASEFGWPKGLFRFILSLVFAEHHHKGELMLDGIAVDPSIRNRGIGTRLMEGVFKFARVNSFGSVRIDVVDTNMGAYRFYERMGFLAIKKQRIPFLRRVMGFSAVTTMVKEIV